MELALGHANIAPGWFILLCTEKYAVYYSRPDVWLQCKGLGLLGLREQHSLEHSTGSAGGS